MGENPADAPRILNGRDHTHAAATARTREHVKLEGAPHEVGPRPIARLAGRFRLQLRDAARARVNGTCIHQRGRRALGGYGAGAPAGMGGEDAVVQHEIDARPRGQGGELFEEFPGLEEQVAGAIVPDALQLQQDAAVAGEPEAVLGDRRPEQVAAELLEPAAVVGRHEQVGVEIEALEVGLARTGRRNPGGVGVAPEGRSG